MKVNRDFEINGAKFHLNDGKGIFCKSKYDENLYHLILSHNWQVRTCKYDSCLGRKGIRRGP